MFDVLRAQENPAQFFSLAAGLVAVETRSGANAARAEKPRLGLLSLTTASHLGFAVCNSTTALGLRTGWVENRGGAYRWARYYNSLTGRFLSRDPEAGKPADPKSLHKYLYAGGDPVNAIDPTGRGTLIETVLLNTELVAVFVAQDLQGKPLVSAIAEVLCVGQKVIQYLSNTAEVFNKIFGLGIPSLPSGLELKALETWCSGFGY